MIDHDQDDDERDMTPTEQLTKCLVEAGAAWINTHNQGLNVLEVIDAFLMAQCYIVDTAKAQLGQLRGLMGKGDKMEFKQ